MLVACIAFEAIPLYPHIKDSTLSQVVLPSEELGCQPTSESRKGENLVRLHTKQ